MDKLGPDEQQWIDVLRADSEPSTDDRARVRAAVFAGIAAGATTAASATGLAKSSAIAKGVGAGAVLTGGWKIGLAVVAMALAGSVASILVLRGTRGSPPPSAVNVVETSTPPPANVAPPAEPATLTTPIEAIDTPAPSSAPRAPVRATPPRAKPPSDDVDAELHLLAQAQRALERGEPNQSLVLLAQHAREHPGGALSLEREGLRAIASCEAKRSDGRAIAERFVAAHPTSPLVARIHSTCLSP